MRDKLTAIGRDPWRLVRYVTTGLISTGLYLGLYWVFRAGPDLAPNIASAVALVITIVIQYFLHAIFTFRRDSRDRNQAVRFFTAIGIGLVVSEVIVGRIGVWLDWPETVRVLLVTIVLPITNYFLFSLWVFAQRPAAPKDGEA